MKEVNIGKNPYLIIGQIMHQRFWPKKNYFKYRSLYISFPISLIDSLKKGLFSLNKFNLFSFFNKDYGARKDQDLNLWIKEILQKNNVTNISKIILVTHPKICGYLFNPVSFWLCLDKNLKLKAVLCEVNNTCGQSHNYLCFNDDLSEIKPNIWLEANKEFYVSPFFKIEGKYKFRFEYLASGKLNFFINYFVDEKLQLSTFLKCKFVDFNSKNLLINFIKIPFATFKTIILIHYQALKLWFNKIKFYPCPKAKNNNLTIAK